MKLYFGFSSEGASIAGFPIQVKVSVLRVQGASHVATWLLNTQIVEALWPRRVDRLFKCGTGGVDVPSPCKQRCTAEGVGYFL